MVFKNIIKNRHNLLHSLVFLFINLTIAVIILFRTAYNASDLEIVPDSVEYTVAASRLVTDQSYTVVIDGQSWPPRYAPWFSMLVIAPAYLIFGNEPGNAVFPILFASLLGIGTAFVIGYQYFKLFPKQIFGEYI